MTDLELTKACAEMMGYEVVQRSARKKDGWWCIDLVANYDPLHDDAQAMALVKRFHLLVNNGVGSSDTTLWHVQTQDDRDGVVENHDLNRAIVKCVAKLKERP